MSDLDEPLSDKEAERMERGIRRFLNTPPQPHGKNPTTPRRKGAVPASVKGTDEKPKPRS